MNGFELLSLLKKDPETSGIPVLILSSLDEEEAIVKSLDEGADLHHQAVLAPHPRRQDQEDPQGRVPPCYQSIVLYSFAYLLLLSGLLFLFILARRLLVESRERKDLRLYEEMERELLEVLTAPSPSRAAAGIRPEAQVPAPGP